MLEWFSTFREYSSLFNHRACTWSTLSCCSANYVPNSTCNCILLPPSKITKKGDFFANYMEASTSTSDRGVRRETSQRVEDAFYAIAFISTSIQKLRVFENEMMLLRASRHRFSQNKCASIREWIKKILHFHHLLTFETFAVMCMTVGGCYSYDGTRTAILYIRRVVMFACIG